MRLQVWDGNHEHAGLLNLHIDPLPSPTRQTERTHYQNTPDARHMWAWRCGPYGGWGGGAMLVQDPMRPRGHLTRPIGPRDAVPLVVLPADPAVVHVRAEDRILEPRRCPPKADPCLRQVVVVDLGGKCCAPRQVLEAEHLDSRLEVPGPLGEAGLLREHQGLRTLGAWLREVVAQVEEVVRPCNLGGDKVAAHGIVGACYEADPLLVKVEHIVGLKLDDLACEGVPQEVRP